MFNLKIIKKAFDGDIYSLAKIISRIESASSHTGQIMQEIFPHCTGANIIGITGPPGAGKSTLIYHLAKKISENGKKCAVLAIDPNSHITGGALLGDRIRMDDLKDVYIRSIGNRCTTGGIAAAAYFIIKTLEACKYDYIFIETVGAGQSEVKIKDLADITLLVLAPGLGDDIQAHKAGIMEIGDIFVVNKADKPDAIRLETEIKNMLKISSDHNKDVFATDCINGQGIPALISHIESMILQSGANDDREVEKLKEHFAELLEIEINTLIKKNFHKFKNTDEIMGKILSGELNITDLIDNNTMHVISPDKNYNLIENKENENEY